MVVSNQLNIPVYVESKSTSSIKKKIRENNHKIINLK